MVPKDIYTLVNKQSGELAFKLHKFDELNHFDHLQRLNYFTLIWIKEGNGKVIADHHTFEFDKNQIYAFSPFQPFMFAPSNEVKGVIIQFHSDFFCILKHHNEVACNGVMFNNAYRSPSIQIDQSAHATIEMIVDQMQKEISRDGLALNESILSYLKLILIHCARLKKEQNQEVELSHSENSNVASKLKEAIEKNFSKQHSPKSYADDLHISPNALAKIAKTHFNKTLTALISERIIIEAKRELYLTNNSVRQIASGLGYEDEFYFSRFFKKHTKVSPTEFRKSVGFAKGEA